MKAVDVQAAHVDRLEAASMKLLHAAAMADVMHDFDFRDIPGRTLQAYVHGLRTEIDAAKEMVDEAASATMRNGTVAHGQSSTVPSAGEMLEELLGRSHAMKTLVEMAIDICPPLRDKQQRLDSLLEAILAKHLDDQARMSRFFDQCGERAGR